MLTIVTLWWLSFFTVLGLCVGSFLNVVIYRLPMGCSLRAPRWSFCPHCRRRIRWYDNIPVLSFLLLGGRCRECSVPISTRYPVIEIITAMLVLMLLDAFFIGEARDGLFRDTRLGLTESLAYDWPILLAHIVLFSCLLAMSAIDLEHYWVDVRFTNFATLTGFACHVLWTPRHSASWIRPWDTTAVMCLFALGGLVLVWLVVACRPHVDPEDFGEPVGADATDEDSMAEASPSPVSSPPSLQSPSRAAAWMAAAMLVVLFVLLFVDESGGAPLRHAGRALVPLLFVYLLIVAESIIPRESDRAIMDAIHEERHDARRMVLDELSVFLPAIAFGVLGFWIMRGGGGFPERVATAGHGEVHVAGVGMMRHWSPLTGLATAATGYIIAGAIGWAVRIVFTLVFGKEAFGTGDVHMMAAAGCVAGWPVVLIGFFLTCVVALVGWLAALPFKRTRAVPLGPWLSVSFLAVVLFYNPILKLPFMARAVDAAMWLFLGGPPPG